jgi:hypothetical protein
LPGIGSGKTNAVRARTVAQIITIRSDLSEMRTTRRPGGHLQPSDGEALLSAGRLADHDIVRRPP